MKSSLSRDRSFRTILHLLNPTLSEELIVDPLNEIYQGRSQSASSFAFLALSGQ